MSSKYIGINEARPVLGDLITQVQQGADIVLTRNGKPAARIVRYQEDIMELVTEQVEENYSPVPGRMAARTIWLAYPEHVRDYGAVHDRIERAYGTGDTEEDALANARAAFDDTSGDETA